MRILLITQYFYPENFKSNDIAFELVKSGYQVDALVGIPNYPDGEYYKGYGIFHKRIEMINGVHVYRAFQTPRGRKASGLGLSLNYLSYAFFASIFAMVLAFFKKYDCIIVHQTSPITQALPAILIKKIQRIPLYTWVLDLWPDAMKSGGGVKNQKIINAIDKIVKLVYNQSDKILISSKGFVELIAVKGDFADKLIYFPNWSDDFLKMPIVDIPKLPDGFIIMMAGNLGSAQKLDAVLNAALELKEEKNIKWVFIGDGRERTWMEKFVNENNLNDMVYILGKYPFETMPSFYYSANAMLLTLKADFPHLKAVVPARLQSYLSASKPVLAMVDGGAAEIIRESNCGFFVPAADYKALVDVIKHKVLKNIEAFEKMGKNGRKYYEENFKKESCIQHLINIIDKKNGKT